MWMESFGAEEIARANKALRGQDDNAAIKATVEAIRAAGINVIGNYIFGLRNDDVSTMSDLVAASLQQRRFTTSLLAVFAALAVLLAFVGLYGVITQIVTQRTYEIGVRMALGANPNQVRRMVVFQGMQLNFIGLILGVICSLALTRLMKSMLFGVKPWDPVTIIVVVILLSFVTLLAAYLPSRRAARQSPVETLRCE